MGIAPNKEKEAIDMQAVVQKLKSHILISCVDCCLIWNENDVHKWHKFKNADATVWYVLPYDECADLLGKSIWNEHFRSISWTCRKNSRVFFTRLSDLHDVFRCNRNQHWNYGSQAFEKCLRQKNLKFSSKPQSKLLYVQRSIGRDHPLRV